MDSPEYKTLTLCSPTLLSCIRKAPFDITVHLESSGILAQRDIAFIRNEAIDNDRKASQLLDVVLSQVQFDPQVYHAFIAALKNSGFWTRAIVSELERTYDSVMQSPTADVPSTEEPGASPNPFRRDNHLQSSLMVELCKRFQLSDEDIDKKISDEHILEIYPQLHNWRLVAAHLGLTQADVKAIESKARPDEELMRFYMLHDWKEKKRLNGTDTYRILLKALMECNSSESALQMCEFLSGNQGEEFEENKGKKIFDEAMKAGFVTVRINTVLLFGMAGAGKTSTMHLILGLPPPEARNSTSATDSTKRISVRDVSEKKIQFNESSWKLETVEDMKRLTSKFLNRNYPNPPPELKTKLKQLNAGSPTSATALPLSTADHQNDSLSNTAACVKSLAAEMLDLSSTDNQFDSYLDTTSGIIKMASEIHTLSAKHLTNTEKELLCYNYVYLIDSGGQPQFHNLLPLFVQGISTALYILDLNYGPNDFPLIDYFKKGELLGKRYRSNLTNAENFCFLMQSIKSLSNQCRLLCIGTHAEEADIETIQENNLQLLKLLPEHFKESKKCIYKNGEKEFIFPINTLIEENREKLTEDLRNVIWPPIGPFQECMFKEIKIPAWWYFLEIMLKTQFSGRKILHYNECLQIAHDLNFHEEALREALAFFHKHHIFHYYKFLPNVVFCDTQVLMDKVTELVEYAASPSTDGSRLRLAKEGILTLEILKSEKQLAKHYIPSLFEPKDLITIFEKLLVVTELVTIGSGQKQDSENKQYIMPAILDSLPESELLSYRVLTSPVAPLLIHFESGFIKCGVFCCLQVHLLNSPGWELSNEVMPKQNCMKYKVYISNTYCLVTVINNHNSCLEIHVKPVTDICPEFCFEVKDLILKGIKQARSKLGYNTSDKIDFGFFCPCEVTDSQQQSTCSQIAQVRNNNIHMACKKNDEHFTKLQNIHNVWFQYEDSAAKSDKSSSATIPSKCCTKEGESSFSCSPSLTQEIEIKISLLKQRLDVTDKQLNRECEDEDLNHFGQNIAGYMEYATGLGLTQAEIGNLDGNVNIAHSTQLKLAAAFKLWKSKHKADSLPVTYRSLLKVALKLKDGNGAEEICRTCRKGQPTPLSSLEDVMDEMDTKSVATFEPCKVLDEEVSAPPKKKPAVEPQLPRGRRRRRGRSRGTVNYPKPGDRKPGHNF